VLAVQWRARKPRPRQPVQILHQDDTLIAVNKPSGLLTHRSWIDADADDFALQRARALTGRRLYPVHRLDRPTSGLLLFACSPDAARAVQAQMDDGTLEKVYLAVVRGWTDEAGRIDHALADDPKLRQGRLAIRPAVTDYRRLATAELPVSIETYPSARFSLVRLVPRTGRSRQLRRHLAHIAHPIIGDTSHGRGAYNRWFRKHLDCHRLLLHAHSMVLRHPLTGESLRLRAPIDDPAMIRALDHLGLTVAVRQDASPDRTGA
jgi:tRNA pseudouridine65 synthase